MNKKILGVVLLAFLFVPTVTACHWETEPEPVKLDIHIKIIGPQFVWNGFQWIYLNPSSVVIDGVTWSVY